jgi:hypothetical protein
MKNLKQHIFEKLKVTKNTIILPDIEEFKDAIYKLNVSHEISFDDVDLKYKELKNCPQYKSDDKLYYVVSLFVSLRMNVDKFLYIFCSNGVSPTFETFRIESIDQLVEVLGEELVLQIWDYIK